MNMSEKVIKIKWYSNILPPEYYGKVSQSMLCLTNKGHRILKYDHLLDCWYHDDNPKQEFKGTVLKWMVIPE